MFEFLFRYPSLVFTKGRFVLLTPLPIWLLLVLIFLCAGGLALLIRSRLHKANSNLCGWRGRLIWGLQSSVGAILLVLLWRPAVNVSSLTSQKNIIAIVVDDSRSMTIKDSDGKTREAAALSVLQNGVLSGLRNRFQTRIYKLGDKITQVQGLQEIKSTDKASHISKGLMQLVKETSDLPIGAILLLTDGGENSDEMDISSISLEALQALQNRRIPVHTIGFGRQQALHDIEVGDIGIPERAIANAKIAANVSWKQYGYAGGKARLVVRDGNIAIVSREITMLSDGVIQTESFFFSVGSSGSKLLHFGIEPLAKEENVNNNFRVEPIQVSDIKQKILYVEGEPRWEFKFIRRAEEDDPTIQLVSMLRTSENKIYRQGISNANELADGFPIHAEDLFSYSGIVIGSVNSNYFTPIQMELLQEYVDRRGGGLLFLGGRSSLADGGWGSSSANVLLPTFLPTGGNSFHRNPVTVELTREGSNSSVTRLLEDTAKNAERWKQLTYLADYEDPGSPKPGATVLVQMNTGRHRLPLLITQSYGRGRTAILATGGTWRWQMSEALGDPSHDLFWQQLLRWLVIDTPGFVSISASQKTLSDDGHIEFTAQVHDRQFRQTQNAHVTAHILGPDNTDAFLDLNSTQEPGGQYQVEWNAEKPGTYVAEVVAVSSEKPQQEIGRDVFSFQRQDGVAENFHTEQNKNLLQQLSSRTGGHYWSPDELKNLPHDISYSEAGIAVRKTEELWNMPIIFLLLLGLMVTEWLLRRKWGIV